MVRSFGQKKTNGKLHYDAGSCDLSNRTMIGKSRRRTNRSAIKAFLRKLKNYRRTPKNEFWKFKILHTSIIFQIRVDYSRDGNLLRIFERTTRRKLRASETNAPTLLFPHPFHCSEMQRRKSRLRWIQNKIINMTQIVARFTIRSNTREARINLYARETSV